MKSLNTSALRALYFPLRRPTSRARGGSRITAAALIRRSLVLSILLQFALLFSPGSGILTYICPIFAVVFGWALLRNSRADYIRFTLWLWFLTPLIRRLVDFRSGGDVHSLILVTPYLASCVPLYEIISGGHAVFDRRSFPLLSMTAAVLLGLPIGLANFGAPAAFQSFLTWIAPLCFALFLYQHRTHFPEMFRTFEQTMICGALVAAGYGVYQYFFLPGWDALWMENVDNPTFFKAVAMDVRVFSTMNGPQVLALFLSTGLLLALHSRDKIRYFASPVIALALVLTMARTAWMSFVFGLIYLVLRGGARLRLQVGVVAAIAVCLFGLALQDQDVAAKVWQRFDTFKNVGHDESFNSRIEGHEALLVYLSDNPFGFGLGGPADGSEAAERKGNIKIPSDLSVQNDSSIAAVMLSLGIFGSLLAGISFVMIAAAVMRLEAAHGSSTEALKVLALVFLVEAPCETVVNGPCGFLTWAVLGLCLAAGAPNRGNAQLIPVASR